MKEELIKHFGFAEICDLISKTNNMLILCMPNLDIEVAHTILAFKLKKDLNDIKVITDNSENNFRNGFGEIKAIEMLKVNGIQLFEIPGNMVSFIISDNIGYYLFPQSKIFAGDEDLTSNAVKINQLDIINLKNYFFPPKTEAEKEVIQNEILDRINKVKEIMTDSFKEIDNNKQKTFKAELLNNKNLETVRKKLEVNPPEHPDLKRQINTYITKVQYVELSFEGEHFKSKNVHIPSKILPFRDKELQKKLISKMKLFGNITEKKEYRDSFSIISKEISEIRKKYLIPLTSRKGKNIIKNENKLNFENSVNIIIEKLPDLSSNLRSLIQQEILNSKDRIKDELNIFLIENPPDNLKDYKDQKTLFKASVKDEIDKLINSIKFPKTEDILDKLNIKYHFYDLTFADFRDSELLNEFKKKKIMQENDIKSIVDIKNAFETKK